MPPKPARVLGPYPNRDKWRLVVLDGNRRKSLVAATEQAAHELKAQLLGVVQEQSDRTLAQLLPDYRHFLQHDRGLQHSTLDQYAFCLTDLLGDRQVLSRLSPQAAAELYRAYTQRITSRGRPIAVDTHRTALIRVKAFFGWCVEQGYARQNPFSQVKPIGACRAGKAQLRIDEARAFVDLAHQRARAGHQGALAALLQLLLGLRSGEVLHRQVRDVDDGGQLLWVTPEAHRLKTRAARRRLAVPLMLQELLRQATQDKQPDDWLIANATGKPHSDSWLWHQVRMLCQQAGLPPICPHSLRGLNATLALEGGATAQAVAAALGHTHFAITARHYADKSAQSNARVRRVAEVLEKQGRAADLLEIAALLQQTLGAAQCTQLAARLLAASPPEDDPSRTNQH